MTGGTWLALVSRHADEDCQLGSAFYVVVKTHRLMNYSGNKVVR